MAVLETGIRERTLLQAGKRGSPAGEIWRGMTQFKSFPMALLMKHGSHTMSQQTMSGKAWYAASLLGTTTLLGGLVVQLKEIANGNDPQDMTSMDFFKRLFITGGGLPILGDLIVVGTDASGRDTAGFLVGPLGSDLATLAKVTVGNATQLANGVDTNAGNEIFKIVKNKIPAQNLWYIKAVANMLIFNQIQDIIALGYRDEIQRKAERQHDRTCWLEDDGVRAPDFEKAIGN